jgi:hypothetical protein
MKKEENMLLKKTRSVDRFETPAVEKKKRPAAWLALAASLAALAGCPEAAEHWTVRYAYAESIFIDGASVYTTGYLRGNNDDYQTIWKSEARLWKDGVPSNLAAPAGGYNTHAYAVYVADGHVYTAGNYCNNQGFQSACYWMDSTPIDLPVPSGASSPSALSISVSNSGAVYTAGSYGVGANWVACYWAGAIEHDLPLPSGAGDAYALSVCVSGTDVYVAGWYVDTSSGQSVACYWKNENETDLSGAAAQATAVFVDGAGVYIAGTCQGSGGGLAACYWQNGTKMDIESGTNIPTITSIFESGGTVYVAGWYGGVSYWTCTSTLTRIDLYASSTNLATGIFVADGSVYVSGSYGTKACYWTVTGGSPVLTGLPISD